MSQLKVNTIRHTGASSDAVTLATDGTCTAKITNNLSNRIIHHFVLNVCLDINKTDTIIILDRLINLLKYKKAKNENV